MSIPYAKRTTAWVKKEYQVQCEFCGTDYRYSYTGKAEAGGEVGLSLLMTDEELKEKAMKKAMRDERNNFYRCSNCGRYQDWMLLNVRGSQASDFWMSIGGIFFMGGIIYAILEGVVKARLNIVLGRQEFLAFLSVDGFFIFLYICWIIYRVFIWNPNDDKFVNKALKRKRWRD